MVELKSRVSIISSWTFTENIWNVSLLSPPLSLSLSPSLSPWVISELSLLECEAREASAESPLDWAGLGWAGPAAGQSGSPPALTQKGRSASRCLLSPLAPPGLLRTILGYLRYKDYHQSVEFWENQSVEILKVLRQWMVVLRKLEY